MEIKRVGVIGCGLMGAGIVQSCVQSGYQVSVREVNDQLLAKGLGRIAKQWASAVEKGKVAAADRDTWQSRIAGTVHLADLKGCDLIIEAVTENVALKKQIWAELDGICPGATIFASNTSSIPIAVQAAATGRKDRFIGAHFFNPVPVMKLVEIIRTDDTSEETYRTAMDFAAKLGKTAVTCKDTCGFIVNRLLVPYLFDAVRALEAGIASKEDIDTGMKLGCGYPMGPLTLIDFVGLDTGVAIGEIMFDAFKLPHYKAPELLKKMVAEGKMGRKSGEGFYKY